MPERNRCRSMRSTRRRTTSRARSIRPRPPPPPTGMTNRRNGRCSRRPRAPTSTPKRHRMDLDKLVAIDVHTHAWKSALQVDDAPTESQSAMGRYFRYQPQHQTVPEMAAMYRKLKMAFVVFTVDGEKGASRRISNEEIAELAHKEGDVAIPFASINPHRGAERVRAAKRLI